MIHDMTNSLEHSIDGLRQLTQQRRHGNPRRTGGWCLSRIQLDLDWCWSWRWTGGKWYWLMWSTHIVSGIFLLTRNMNLNHSQLEIVLNCLKLRLECWNIQDLAGSSADKRGQNWLTKKTNYHHQPPHGAAVVFFFAQRYRSSKGERSSQSSCKIVANLCFRVQFWDYKFRM